MNPRMINPIVTYKSGKWKRLFFKSPEVPYRREEVDRPHKLAVSFHIMALQNLRRQSSTVVLQRPVLNPARRDEFTSLYIVDEPFLP